MQNKRFYAVLVLAVGIVLAALHVADLLQWMDASTGFALQASVWARYLPWLAALAVSIAAYYLIEKPAARHFKKTAQKMHA